ncbi:hypothetical protein [Streptomyces sp. NBC_00354]|uniref:hypothetical protein n=1 Tax=Streptomyces sp. NBC_00354 TaxID=2975723 RepID=UPI002E2607CF
MNASGRAGLLSARQAHRGAYHCAYERLLILVGAFYDIHQGRDAHFRCAQTLSHRDQRPLRLDESFLHIVTGVEDLHDAQDDTVARLFAALREPIAGLRKVGLGGHGGSRSEVATASCAATSRTRT